MAAFTRWILGHKLLVALFWVAVTVVGGLTVGRATGALSQQFASPGSEAYQTDQTLLRTYGVGADPVVLVLTLPAGTTVDTPGVTAQLSGALTQVGAAAPGARIVSYASTGDHAFVLRDGRTTFALVAPPVTPADYTGARGTAAVQAAAGGVRVAGAPFEVTGIAVLTGWGGNAGGGTSVLTETLIGAAGALVVLAFVFGSFLAVVPLIMAVAAILTTFLLVWGVTTVTDVSFIVQFLIGLIGLGVAIDYALLIVVRWREERAAGYANAVAVQRAMETAGLAVIHSGTTVAVGLLALVVLPVPFLRSIGFGGMLIPLVSVLVAITLLPVVLATIGPWLDWPRSRRDAHVSPAWATWARLVVRRRWLAAAAALLVLGALLAAAATLHPGEPEALALAKAGDAHDGVVALEQSGIGTGVLTPIYALAPEDQAGAVAARLAGVDGVRAVVAPEGPAWRRGGTALITVLPAADANSAAGRATLARVRDAAHAGPASARIGGDAAENADFIAAVYGNFPLMVGLIALATFLLLVRAFRSLLLPLKAVLLNVLSVGAAWGVLVLVWQDGYGSERIWGIVASGAITAWAPLMVFAFLFGLSMDYEVFILARMREEYDRAGATDTAIVEGVGRTGRLVTCAALILTFAFVSLASAPVTDIKILATGLAAGILLDATVVRALLVPALVSLMGRWNWWLPAPCARLLRVAPSHPAPEPAPEPARALALVAAGERE
ncbi:MAG TPA: MMPL family transporter [Thermomicrobiales bacterium]|nr:MMPL family transporter [Thermomicrobiales bacterium]